jgi:phosphate acyltransferase
MRIVLDAMGTDDCPGPDVHGGILAAQELGVSVILVGDESAIKRELAKHRTAGLDIEIVHAAQAITMDDKPSVVTKGKPASSMHVGMKLVKSGHGDAFVTMGNTGAAHAIAMLQTFGRIRGIKRPALSAVFPVFGKPVIFTDIGANADSKPEWMLQFALMGAIYAQHALRISQNPTVGLLSNGEEEGKGNELIKETSELLHRTSLNFIGNVEPKQVFNRASDVVVSDGFTGNILVKVYEAGTRYLTENLRTTIKSNVLWSLAGLALKGAFRQVKKKLDTSEVGGAPLLGVDGVVIIGHGSSDGRSVRNAVHQATLAVKGNIVGVIRERLTELPVAEPSINQES